MALDNPSYFTIPERTTSSTSNRSGRFSLLRKHMRMGASSSSSASSNNLATTKTKKNERYSVLPSSSSMATSSSTPASETQMTPLIDSGFRNFRSLTRTTSFDNPIQTQMLVLGMPRPSDIAPSNQHLSLSGKKHHNRNASTGKSYRTPGNDFVNPLRPAKQPETFQNKGSLLPVDERYYNILSGTNFLQTGRRHSIGAYFNRKGSAVSRNELQIQEETSFCDAEKVDFKFDEENVPAMTKDMNEKSGNKNKCGCCRFTRGEKSGMEDIVLISSNRSQAADLWTTYLKTCFDQIRKNRSKPPFRILTLGIEDVGGPGNTSPDLEERLKNSKLVIFIICPVFLDYVGQFPEHIGVVCKHVRPEGVLAMLLGISESTITEDHKTALLSYSQWKRMESVKDRDEKFVGDFLGAAMDIISKNIAQQSQPVEKGSFMLMPKKVNKNQNKVLVLLNEPIFKEDVMQVSVIRNNEVFNIPSVKKRNPYTLIFRMPEEFFAVSALVNIRVERNGADLGTKLLKCESQLYAMVQILKSCDSPVEFMCQALNIVPCDKEKLDDFLVSSFQKNVPPNFNLLQTSGLGHLHRGVICKEEYPTLLHFAARYGLEKLCWVLLECPGGELACDIRNISELTPAEMAESAGHIKLANALCGYMQMTEFTSVYTFLKGMSNGKDNSSKSETSDDYLNPRPLSETYQVPPSPRPLAQLYSHPPMGYMQMHSSKSSQSSSVFGSQEEARNLGSSKEKLLYRKNSDDSLKKDEPELHGYKKIKENSGNGIQDELIEIINDFKNNVFTISEVEKLVEDWRNRNDVQQSFREKQEQLNKMREEYERVQQKLKDEMKQVGRPSPIERIRNFFRTKNKDSKSSDSQDLGDKKSRQEENLLPYRPSSGLSIQSSSSSSSGRLSTGSHCSGTSLGDSGTHSDAESERKFRLNTKCCNKAKDSLDNYDIPPSPVCLLTNKPKQFNGISNYDIPPPSSEAGFKQKIASGENECCFSSDSNEVNYYNLLTKDISIPNQSTLHSRLTGAIHKTCLKSVEESTEIKTEKPNCYEYINLPNGKTTAKCLVVESKEENLDELPINDDRLPDYVNVEHSKIESS